MFGTTSFSNLTPVIKNLIIINVLFFLATISFQNLGIDLTNYLGLHQFQSPKFMPHQLVTHMFMHGSFTHLLFNMLGIFFLGVILEKVWGGKRFLTFYLITGLGAALIYIGYIQIQISSLSTNMTSEEISFLIKIDDQIQYFNESKPQTFEEVQKRNEFAEKVRSEKQLLSLIHSPMVGASGAVYGILLAFGMLFPNTQLMLIFPPIPIKAKYLVFIFAVTALFLGLSNNPLDNIAHFAHLGGMIFGFILIKYWKQDRNTFY